MTTWRGGEELSGLLAAGLGEFTEEVLVGGAEHVAFDVVAVEHEPVESVEQGGQSGFGEAVGVGPVDVAEDADEVAVGGLDAAERVGDFGAEVHGGAVDVGPVAALRDDEGR